MRPRRGYAVPRGIQTGAAAARQRRRAFSMRGVVAVLVALAVGACSGLPTSSPVQSGRSVDEQVLPEVRIVVPPPAAGASPEQIVRGFLRAGAAFQESTDSGQPVANAYLAPGSVGRWRPTSSVTVFDRSRTVAVEALTGDKVRASVAVVATVDDTGHYREVAPGTVAQVDLGLVRVSGEWRVELPADGFGLWLNTDDFGRVFDPHRVHYPTVGGRHLVPDVRWFAGGPRLGTALARAQLGPVPDYLAGAVETGFPADVTLAVDAVSVDAGIATVVLTPPASAMDLAHRRAIWAQLVATLLRVPGVQGVVVEVQGAGRLVVPEVTGPLRSATDVGYGADPLPLPRTALLRLGERLTSVEIVRLDDLDGLGTSPTATATVAVPSAGAGDGPARRVRGPTSRRFPRHTASSRSPPMEPTSSPSLRAGQKPLGGTTGSARACRC
ncbi:MAG: GerMN domain-containing protein [Actinomycetales bacterium]|uniref:GerMN domain-containing protein n=1 Tax=Candidatus Phosphoribacter hodrii TaxID=2953743 RepID=A0A935IQ41_9MICO|nr:GerMN domain-containing protein [Candidatus Phosphoribacter hodrii]